jgi:ornithine carbamoyltransferase
MVETNKSAYHEEHDKVGVFEGSDEVIGDGWVSGHEENDKRHKPQKHQLAVPAQLQLSEQSHAG